jgi:hypothetical protein
MKDIHPSILSSLQYRNITITERISIIQQTRHSRTLGFSTQHGIPTTTRHALLEAHAQPAQHATTSTIHVPKPSTTLPALTKWSSTANANRRYNNLEQPHKSTTIHLHSIKGPRFRPSRIAHLSKTRSHGNNDRDDSPWWFLYCEHMLGNLQLLCVWSRGRYRDHRRARRLSSHQGHGHGAILLGLETDWGEAGRCWRVGVLCRYGVWIGVGAEGCCC